ncbi:MAG: biotin carboxylase N-terminal domain-containing protein [Bdellovibrionota bacterium]
MAKIKRIFIANRGEICARIASTATRLGIETVAITDRKNPPTFLSQVITKFVQVPIETLALYLDARFLLKTATENNCDAIHPGFGFLSENSEFAEMVVAEGLTWIGPSATAIEKMASKSTARNIAMKANVPCIQGIQDFHVPLDADGDFSELENFAHATGYPLLIKAAMGGGGKGMRLVQQESELKEAALRAYSEAKNSFGSGSLICEKYIQTPRHIEVQILADQQGNTYAIGDRDCSVQRRHQKILEEAPAASISEKTRMQLHQCAVSLAKSVGYTSAGTVEFLLDWSKNSQNLESQEFYFLEMNTRLQVEHPVTEEVYGLDLVEWQFNIAEGRALPESFADIKPRGHSIEARLYSEDTEKNFFPAPGEISGFFPYYGPGIRWELGIDMLDEVSEKFDPMVAKVIASASTRYDAISRLSQALRQTFFSSPASNQEFLLDICTNTHFHHEPVGTNFISDEMQHLQDISASAKEGELTTINFLFELIRNYRGNLKDESRINTGSPNIERITQNAFFNTLPNKQFSKVSEKDLSVELRLQINSSSFSNPSAQLTIGQGLLARKNEKDRSFWYSYTYSADKESTVIFLDGRLYRQEINKEAWQGQSSSMQTADEITAPVPGKVVKIVKTTESTVKKGETVFILESMKMEFEVKATRDGNIAEIVVTEGQQVTTGQFIAKWEDNS